MSILKNKKRLIAAGLALTVILVMLTSVCFIIAETNHNCIGEDCPVCTVLRTCETALKTLGCAAAGLFSAAFSLFFCLALTLRSKHGSEHLSPVSLKVRLLN